MKHATPVEGHPPVRVLYIVYWGLLEPLGQSLVLPTVLGLSRRGVAVTLLSYEKRTHTGPSGDESLTQAALQTARVSWRRFRYHKRPRIPAKLVDIVCGWLGGILAVWRDSCEVVHARTFVGGLIGLVVARATGSTLIYHNEGFYSDEQVDSGVWRAGSTSHKLARWLENRLYDAADGIITLSRRAESIVRDLPGPLRKHTPVAVVPSCVDVREFVPHRDPAPYSGGGIRFVYAGSIGGRYRLADVADFMMVAHEICPGSTLTLFSWASPDQVSTVLRQAGLPDRAWSLRSVSHRLMPDALSTHHVGLHFATATAGGAGGSPTKVGEYWASGIPVIVTSGMGDLDEIIMAERVGVVLPRPSPAAFREAILEAEELLRQPGISQRCRAAAEAHYSLENALAAQLSLYQRLRVHTP
jgi:glycosyltransferase involved in cell wall biosynthesis